VCLEISALELRELGFLPVTPSVLVLEPNVACAPPLRGPLDFLAPDLIDRPVDELNDVKLIEGDRRPRQMLTHASLVARRPIHTDRTDVLGTGAMSLERIGKLGHDLGFSPLAGIEYTLGVEVVKQTDRFVSAPRGGLVETNRSDGREVLLSVRLIDVRSRVRQMYPSLTANS